MKRIFFLLLTCFLVISFTACSYFYPEIIELTPEENAYIDRVMDSPTTFTAPKEHSEEIWGRIQAFIGNYSSMRIQIASDYVVSTYNPSTFKYGYKAVKTPQGDTVEFNIICKHGQSASAQNAEQNAHIMAHYAVTGEILEHLVVR